MRSQNNEIAMDKQEFLTNCLLSGIACQLLAQMSNRELSEWMEYLSDEADKQFRQMTPRQREEMINAYIQTQNS